MNFFKSVKENLKDPKKKSLTLLGIYALFFIFVFLVLSSSSTPTPVVEQVKSTKDNYKEMTSYSYKITYTDNNLVNVIEGTYYLNTSLFTYNTNKYYLENDLLYFIDTNFYYLTNIEYNIKKLFNNNLSSILDSLQEESVTTYNDGRKKTNYLMNANDFNRYYFETESNYETNIGIEITEENEFVTNILIDLTNLNINLTKIEVEYSDINKISSLDFNKENYYLESR